MKREKQMMRMTSQSHYQKIETLGDKQQMFSEQKTNTNNKNSIYSGNYEDRSQNYTINNIASKKNEIKIDRIQKSDEKVKRQNLKKANQFIHQLLQLEQRWIIKQTQISQYIQSLHETIKQKDLKLQIVEKENDRLRQKLERGQKQNYYVLNNTMQKNQESNKINQQKNQKQKKISKQYKNEKIENLSIHNNKNEFQQQHRFKLNIKRQGQYKQKLHQLTYQKQLINERYHPNKSIIIEPLTQNNNKLQISPDQLHSTYCQDQKFSLRQENTLKNTNQVQQYKSKLQVEESLKPNKLKNQNLQVHTNLFNYKLKQNKLYLDNHQDKSNDFIYNQQKKKNIYPKKQNIDFTTQKKDNEEQLQRRVMANVRKILQQNNFITHNIKYDKIQIQKEQHSNNNKEINKHNLENFYNDNFLNKDDKINKNFKKQNQNIHNNKNHTFQSSFQYSSLNQSSFNNENKDREIRMTSTTDQTFQTNIVKLPSQKGSIMLKKNSTNAIYQTYKHNQNSESNSQYQNMQQISYKQTPNENYQRKKTQKQMLHNYKSSKTIAFSNQPELNYGLIKEFQQNEFHSENQIIIPHNINVESEDVSPYQSAQATPQTSAKYIKALNNYQQVQSQDVSQVETVKRNPLSKREDKSYENSRHQDSKVKINQSNNIVPNKKSLNKFSTQMVYDQSIKNKFVQNQSKRKQIEVEKKSSLNSQDDPFTRLLQQQTSSKNIIIPFKDDEQQVQQKSNNYNSQRQRFMERKRTRMNTKLTNLDYSLTESNISMSEIEGSLFRDRQVNKKKSLVYESYGGIGVIVPIQQERNQRQSFKVQYQQNGIQVDQQIVENQNSQRSIQQYRYQREIQYNYQHRQRGLKQNQYQRGVMTQSIKHQQQKAIQVAMQEEKINRFNRGSQLSNQIHQLVNPTKQQINSTKQQTKTALKYNIKARLLLEQNSQTQSKLHPVSSQVIDNDSKTYDLSKKLSFSSSAGSKFYCPHQKQQEQQNKLIQDHKNGKVRKNQLLFNPSVYQCNIRNKSTIQKYTNELKQQGNKSPLLLNKTQYNHNEHNLHDQDYYDSDHIIQLQKQPFTKLSKNTSSKSILNKNNRPLNSQNQIHESNKRSNLEQQFYSSNDIGKKNINRSQESISQKNHSLHDISQNSKSPSSKHTGNNKFIDQRFLKKGSYNNDKIQQQPKYFKKPSPIKQNIYNPSSKTNPKKSSSVFIHQQQRNTTLKQPEFDQQQYECYTASDNKGRNSLPFQQNSRFSYHNKSQMNNKYRRVPQTKSTTFKQKSQTNHYYLEKSPSQQSQYQKQSNRAFKKMYKFTTESSQSSQHQRQQQQQQQRLQFQYRQKERQKQRQSLHSNASQTSNSLLDVDKILFENSMLKSYNSTLQNKIKKSGKMEKLIEKFNSQNVSIRNKIHKKSIS